MAVARRATRQVSTNPIPGARLTATETDLSAGVGLEQARAGKLQKVAGVTGGLAQAATGALAQTIREERQKANETALLKADNALEAWRRKRLNDPDSGALAVKGEAAMGLPEQVGDEFNKLADDIAAGLNDEQRSAFDKIRSQTFGTIDLEVRRHVFNQMQEFRSSELKAGIDLGIDAATRSFADPELVGVHIANLEAKIRTNLPRLGVGKEGVEQQVAAVKSQVHVGVINNLLESDFRKARQYFEEAQGEIAPDKLDDVKKALEAGTVRGESQTIADTVLGAGGTLREQLVKVKGMNLEPEVRDAVEQRLEHDAALKDREEAESEKDAMRAGYDILDKTGRTDKIPAAVWSGYSGATRSAMRSYAEQKAKGIPIKTDLPTYYARMTEARDHPETFATRNLLEDRARLDETEFKQLAGLQLSIANGNRTDAEKVLADFRTSSQVVDDALVGIGINPTVGVDKDEVKARAVANLRRMVDVRVATLQGTTGEKIRSKDVQSIVDEILSQQIKTPGWFGTSFGAGAKPLIETTIDDIDSSTRKQIEDALRGANRPINDSTIISTYLEAIARGKVK